MRVQLLLALSIGFLFAAPLVRADVFSWQRNYASVEPTGDLEWTPQTFEFKAGPSRRFIDYDGGDDDNDGATPQTAWKHHPWDPAALGRAAQAEGMHTYIFKRGVVYRGVLRPDESGETDQPIRLTSDPGWGSVDKEAVICGSGLVTGWVRLDRAPAATLAAPTHITAALGEWGTVRHPAAISADEDFDIAVDLPETHEGQKLVIGLNWMKKGGQFGGFNAPGKPGHVDAKAGTHTFHVKPRPKPDISGFSLTVYLSTSGSWADRTIVATASIALTGAEPVAADVRNRIPQPENVYVASLDFAPRNVWMVGGEDRIVRIPLARTPNWQVVDEDDIKSQWWQFDNPGNPHFKTVKVGKTEMFLGIDTVNITQTPSYYEGAYIWNEYGWVMGTPYPSRIAAFFPDKQGFAIEGQWSATSGSRTLPRWSRYYLEDKPEYLDDPDGEFWFDKQGAGGKLYLRLPGAVDPADVQIEAGRHLNLIDAENLRHVHISGLTFRYTNTWWDLDASPFKHKDVDPACIRLLGSGDDIVVANCRFEHVNLPVRFSAAGDGAVIDGVVIRDNVISNTDHGAISLGDGSNWGEEHPTGRLLDVKVLRNSLSQIGKRPTRWGQGHAIDILCAETCEVTGNMLDQLYGAGIFVFGGKRSGAKTDRPLSRILIHHNKVTNSMLNNNDWGGIETWQAGPAYVYDNISGNPGGYKMWGHRNQPDVPGTARFGHAYYMDGGFKQYYFNNIAWGKSSDPFTPLGNTSAFQEIHGYFANVFNNTAYNFVVGSRRQAPGAGRNKYMGNIWHTIGEMVFRHADPSKTKADPNAADAGIQASDFEHASNAYVNNLLFQIPDKFAVFEPSGRWHATLESFRSALATRGSIGEVGELVDSSPLRNPAKHDFRPAATAVDKGVRMFVPWSLYATVGEWGFYHAGDNATHILDEHFHLAPNFVKREDYHNQPLYPLHGVNVTAADYTEGPLEDWTRGALTLNGRSQYAVVPSNVLDAGVEEPELTVENETYDWIRFDAPPRIVPDRPFDVKIHLKGVKDGLQLRADLHWVKTNKQFGGMNAYGGEGQIVRGPGPYTIHFAPKDNPRLGHFVITAWLTPTGGWKDRTQMARFAVPKGLEAPEGGYRSPRVDRSSFLIEAYLRTQPGASGVVAELMRNAGYSVAIDESGRALFAVKSNSGEAHVASTATINDGQWHHIIAECDRDARRLSIYIDGKLHAAADGIGNDVSLAGGGDLYVGGTPDGRCLASTFEFLRIARGTLADAKTTIEELYAWQFNGPFLRDFCGKTPIGKRDAGAIEQ